GVARKLGLVSLGEEDVALANDLFTALAEDKADFTLAFRFIAEQIEPVEVAESIESLFSPGNKLLEWLPRWMQRQAREEAPASERQAVMFAASPAFIPRNHLIQRAIEDGEEGDFNLFHRLVERLAEPARYDPADRELALPATPQEAVLRTFCGT
ncbi:MAG: protein adenylyltransferase SelO family protein, partial [Pseudomonadota bacterium]